MRFLTFSPFVLDDGSVDVVDADFYPIRSVQVRCNRQRQSPVRLLKEKRKAKYKLIAIKHETVTLNFKLHKALIQSR